MKTKLLNLFFDILVIMTFILVSSCEKEPIIINIEPVNKTDTVYVDRPEEKKDTINTPDTPADTTTKKFNFEYNNTEWQTAFNVALTEGERKMYRSELEWWEYAGSLNTLNKDSLGIAVEKLPRGYISILPNRIYEKPFYTYRMRTLWISDTVTVVAKLKFFIGERNVQLEGFSPYIPVYLVGKPVYFMEVTAYVPVIMQLSDSLVTPYVMYNNRTSKREDVGGYPLDNRVERFKEIYAMLPDDGKFEAAYEELRYFTYGTYSVSDKGDVIFKPEPILPDNTYSNTPHKWESDTYTIDPPVNEYDAEFRSKFQYLEYAKRAPKFDWMRRRTCEFTENERNEKMLTPVNWKHILPVSFDEYAHDITEPFHLTGDSEGNPVEVWRWPLSKYINTNYSYLPYVYPLVMDKRGPVIHAAGIYPSKIMSSRSVQWEVKTYN